MKNYLSLSAIIMALLGLQSPCFAETTVPAVRADTAPVVDGRGLDPVWAETREVIVHDQVAAIDVSLRAIYAGKELFILVQFLDPDESRLHKPWVWNPKKTMYEIGPEREDCFVFKWSMSGRQADLSVHSDSPYTADIWFWKAHRTDRTGYADDKIHVLTATEEPKTRKMISRSGKAMFLARRGDKGMAAYKSTIQMDYLEDKIDQFNVQRASGSRADVRAKGAWSNGRWTVEFARALTTGQSDDIQFDTSMQFLFGISRYEIAGRKPDPAITQPLFGAGDVSEKLILVFVN